MRVGPLAGTAAAVAAVLSCCYPLAAAAAVPPYIRTYEDVRVAFPRSATPGATIDSASLTAFGQRFDLVLEPSPILAENAATVVLDSRGSHPANRQNKLYRGHLADDPEAYVRVSTEAGALDGYVRRGGLTYFMEPLSRYQQGGIGRTLVYRESDVDAAALPPATCGTLEATPHAGTGAKVGGVPRDQQRGLQTLELVLVADFQMYELHGTATTDYILTIVNQVDGFYMANLGVTLRVIATVVYASPGIEPLSATTDAVGLLSDLSAARAGGGALGGGGATHLFTGRDLDGSVIGIAYVDAVCHSSSGVGLSQNFAQDNHMMSLLVGHELGHNLGAFHDGTANSPCSGSGYGWVMWPTLKADLAEEFSECSKHSIAPVVEAAQCITPAIPAGCGNGVVDPAEECDDGNNEPRDCCAINCLFEPAAGACLDDADECTDDVCDGAGVCRHTLNTAPCDDGDICTYDGVCSSGNCVPLLEYRPFDNTRLNVTVRPGIDDDALILSANLSVDELASPPTAGGVSVRVSDADDVPRYQAAVAASLWRDARGLGNTFLFRTREHPARSTNGITSMSVRYRPATGLTRIRARVAGADLRPLDGRRSVKLRIQIGDDLVGNCAQDSELVCGAYGKSLLCR